MYFDLLPKDLIPPLLLTYSPNELIEVGYNLTSFPAFSVLHEEKLDSSNKLWQTIYHRDISSCTNIKDKRFDYSIYCNIFDVIKTVGSREAVQYLAALGYDRLIDPFLRTNMEYDSAIVCAMKCGHKEIVKKVAELCFNHTVLGQILVEAATIGDMEIVELMLAKGVNTYDGALMSASQYGHLNVIERILPRRYYIWWNDLMVISASNGHTDIVLKMLNLGATNHDECIRLATVAGHIDVVKVIVQWVEDHDIKLDMNQYMVLAIDIKNIELLKFFLTKNVTDYKTAISAATSTGSDTITILIQERFSK